MSNEYPPFSGTKARCVKCGTTKPAAFVEYRAGSICLHKTYGSDDTIAVAGNQDPNERLHRQCRVCGYMWDEACVSEEDDSAPVQ